MQKKKGIITMPMLMRQSISEYAFVLSVICFTSILHDCIICTVQYLNIHYCKPSQAILD